MIIALFWLVWITLSLALAARLLLRPTSPAELREAEQVSGLLAAGLGTVVLLALVFVPLPYGTATATAQGTATGSVTPGATRIVFQSLWEAGIGPRLAVYPLIVALLVVWTALLAFLHAHRGIPAVLALLWGATGLLALAILAGLLRHRPRVPPRRSARVRRRAQRQPLDTSSAARPRAVTSQRVALLRQGDLQPELSHWLLRSAG